MPPPARGNWAKMTPREKAMHYLAQCVSLTEKGGMSDGEKAAMFAAASTTYAVIGVLDALEQGVRLDSSAANEIAALTSAVRELVSRVGQTI